MKETNSPESEWSVEFSKIAPADTWELMWRQELQASWIAGTVPLVHTEDRAWAVCDAAGVWRTGHVVRAKGQLVQLRILAPPQWGAHAPTEVSITAERTQSSDGTLLRIVERGLSPGPPEAEAARFWTQALDQLKAVVNAATRRRARPRQAVIVIHGIGDQEPGRTLRAFTDGGVLPPTLDGAGPGDDDEEPTSRRWVKPDRSSGSFELRKVRLEQSSDRRLPPTEIFEFYWAHLIQDTTVQQVASWVRSLLLRRHVPRAIRPLWIMAWCLVLLAAAVAAAVALKVRAPAAIATSLGVLVVVVPLAWRLAGRGLAIGYLGDAARYLRPRPENVAHRQEIRQAGVELLERLHRSGNYDRIVVVGHSLGSVIAYDILINLWIRMYDAHRSPARPAFTKLQHVANNVIQKLADVETAQTAQHNAWQELRQNGMDWLITDFITCGSPLTYADFLVARNPDELAQAIEDRVLPTCPPHIDERRKPPGILFQKGYVVPATGAGTNTFTLLDHAGLFAVTRWTNLFFKQRLLGLGGDPVGGRLAPLLGGWIRDISMESPIRRFAHTRYWAAFQPNSANAGSPEPHLTELRGALRLECGEALRELAKAIPAFALVTPSEHA